MISTIISSSLRLAASSSAPSAALVGRQLSMTATQSASKLSSILEEYRAQNYAMELPRRFRQDIVKAACSSRQYNAQATVSADGIESVLQNIGAGNRMSRSEIDEILNEVGVCPVNDGNAQCVISASQMIELISKH
mmetsp:Transcript_26429/g.53069  ORF Transcript_26429/g.53069 Transcript_26429/m.53069 type:complete len:136 (+) Transcript_26429:145-552(+)|eukprot:CAMPEP_0113389490 /NCGR_PEP_ID=MMETSP0013_2-20120614/9653_1 /TAXON_ID=2843 ORGANISM="Skeletonema costatum, Strain 1716" /NCGR_SAMPLE_ID=MMETSP0013_2 /ASSEMBLY_ACC=CAM_ASM_000158 /LENGTH=135 /DNA_ID=CAMNT_0000272567 /DNA_START=101 /DNA_END=508 /DNA_ORIENTATION=+ /assembly_acc=CAM_ASM_000158